MSFITRALYYLRRKTVRNLVTFFLFATVASSLVAVMALSKSMSGKVIEKNNIAQTVTLSASNIFVGDGYGSGELSEKALQEIGHHPDVESFVSSVSSFASLENAKPVPIGTSEGDYRPGNLETVVNVEGISTSEKDNRFTTGMLSLVSGRHITAGDKHKVIVHEDFAKHNHLKVGDQLTLGRDPIRYIGTDKTPIQAEIIGIFKGKTFNRPNYSDELVSNTLLSDTTIASELFGFETGKTLYSEATYTLKKSADTKAFIANIKQTVDTVNWQNYQLTEQNPALKSYNRSIVLLQKTVKRLLIGTIITSAIVLILLLIFNSQSRLRESGVLLALGRSKWDIMAQHILENILLALPAFAIASLLGQMLGQSFANQTVDSVAKTVRADILKQLGGYSLGADSQTDLIMQTVKHFQVQFTPRELSQMLVVCAGLIVVGILIASIPLMSYKPKDILTKIS
ncbi:ABC transporter permease [Streptococcus marmotae]|uniref:ABC transporter permease n=1 Tax=Streptococcus marmotae TaxID=1825069 RepID=UPI00082B22B3|nr:ABC transporter permease [Streptococcus marmotae]